MLHFKTLLILLGETFRLGKSDEFFFSDENFARRIVSPDKVSPDKIVYFGSRRKKKLKVLAKYLPLHFNYIEQQQTIAVSLTCHRPYFLTMSLHE